MKAHEAGPPEGGTHGTPPILISEAHACPDCGDTHLLEECPDCGSRNVAYDFGLGCGPGFGPYKYCEEEGCDWHWKEMLPHDEA